MTQTVQTPRIAYAGSGSAGPFSVPFYFGSGSELAPSKLSGGVTVALAYPGDFSVTGAGVAAGGTLTLTVALAVGETLAIVRSTAKSQSTAYVANDTFPAASHEAALDKLTREVQENSDIASRALRLSDFAASYDAGGLAVRNAAPGTSAADAVTLSQVQGLLAAAGLGPSGNTYTRASTGAVSRPYVQRLMGRRYLSDFIDPALWAAIRGGSNTAPLVNSLGQDSWAAALADIPAAGGDLTLEEGTFLIPAGGLLLTKPGEIKGIRRGTTLKTASATDDMVTLKGFGITVAGLRFAASVPRTGGACARFVGGFTSQDWVQDCSASLPFMQVHFDRAGGLNVSQSHVVNFNVEDNVVAGGGFALLESANASTIENCTSGAVSGQSAYGIKVTSAADLTLLNNQMLSFNRNLYLIPDATCEIDSVRSMANFFDNSSFHALDVDTTNGPVQRCGSVNDWFLSGAAGATAVNISSPNGTYSADGYDFDCVQIPSAGAGSGGSANGVLLNGNVKNIHLTSGFICNTQTGFVTLATGGHSPSHFSLGVGMKIGPHSGLGANNNGLVIDAGADWFQTYADATGNVTLNVSNAAGTSANRRVVAGLF